MRRFLPFALLLVAPAAFAGSTSAHQVTVDVQAINEVAITGGNLTLTIDSATAGGAPAAASDSTTGDLDWSTNESSRKITVATDLAAPKYSLTVDAANATGGTGAGAVSLSTTAQDFVTGISATAGGCDLSYSASATLAAGVGTDVHNVTYTIISAL